MTKNKKKEKIEEIEKIEEKEEVEEVVEEYEEKEVTIMDMLNRIFVCLIIISVILAINTIVLICKDGSSSNKEETKTSDSTSSNSNNDNCIDGYDVSMMDEVDLEGILDLFDSKKTYVLYIGRCDCSACAAFLPTLQQAQEDYDFTTKYYDINKLNSSDSDFAKVQEKLSYKYTMQSSDGSDVTETFGYWVGYTPMTIIIKDGKQVDGEIGAVGYDELSKMLENNGFKK